MQQWLARRALDDVDLTGVTSLLDVGCGDGRVTQSLAQRIPDGRCVGIDPSPGMIAVAPASGNLTFEVDAVETMRFDDEFDLVVSFNALHWVTDQRRALSAVRAALHVGGRAVLVFVCGGPRPSMYERGTRQEAGLPVQGTAISPPSTVAQTVSASRPPQPAPPPRAGGGRASWRS